MNIAASPSVRAEARRFGFALDEVARATGRERVTREDLARHASGENSVQSSAVHARYWDVDHTKWGAVTREPMSRVAQVAAANLSAAQALIPQVTNFGRADMRRLEAFRASLKDDASARGVKLTALAFHVKALARCLSEFPQFNASLSADGQELILKRYLHIGVAVDAPHGLLVPAVRDADRKGVWRLAAEIADLASRAQTRKLRADEMGGASMSISNLGAIRPGAFTPLVNPPEVAILGVSRAETVPVWEEGEWKPVAMAPLSLSWDHRVVTGAEAARFLTRYEALIGEPRRLLI